MTNRRKFLAGIGALASGSAAAVGTGAVTTQESTRNVDIDVANDSNGSLAFKTSGSSIENSEYAEYSNGQLTLQFDGRDSGPGENGRLGAEGSAGLNPDSTYYFDNVFQILNQTQDALALTFDRSGLDNPSAFTVYVGYTNGSVIGSRDSHWSGAITSGNGINVGVKIETPDSVSSNWETGSLTVTAKDTSDSNV